MKKALSILLLSLLLYNMLGYYLIFTIRQFQVKMAVSKLLDNNKTDDSEVLILKIPVSLPYPIYRVDFEPASGSFRHKGKFYEKTKQILRNDTLYIHCVENKAQNQLHSELSQHTLQHLLNFAGNQNDKSKEIQYQFIKEYLPVQSFDFNYQSHLAAKKFNKPSDFDILAVYLKIASPPPKSTFPFI